VAAGAHVDPTRARRRLQITAVLADAEFGDVTTFRRALHRWRLPYAVGVSRHLTLFPGTPAVHVPPSPRTGRPRSPLVLVDDTRPIALSAFARTLPPRAWRRITWRNGSNRPWAARFAAWRVTPANEWRNRRLAPEVWLLCEQDFGATPRTKYFFINLPATASVKQLVHLAHQRTSVSGVRSSHASSAAATVALSRRRGREWATLTRVEIRGGPKRGHGRTHKPP
jgi:SRSO17 transposase